MLQILSITACFFLNGRHTMQLFIWDALNFAVLTLLIDFMFYDTCNKLLDM